MHIKTQLDLDVIAIERDDQVSLACRTDRADPGAAGRAIAPHPGRRPGQERLDGRERLDGAKAALTALVNRLDPADRFGLVTFDDEVKVEIAAAPMTDKNAAKHRIAGIQPRGITNPVGGLPARAAGSSTGENRCVRVGSADQRRPRQRRNHRRRTAAGPGREGEPHWVSWPGPWRPAFCSPRRP